MIHGVSGFGSDVLVFPLAAGVDLALTTLSYLVLVRPAIDLAFFEQAFLDECIKVRIEPPVVNLGLVVLFEFVLDR